MANSLTHSAPQRRFFFSQRMTAIAVAAAALIVLSAVLSWSLPLLTNPRAPENAPMPVSSAIEDKYGVRISQVAVTADGGMVDFRYVVLDPNKAQTLALNANSTPKLISHGSQIVVNETAPMPHKDTIHAGTTYYLIYHNTNGSIKAQTYITVQLGTIKLENVPVR